MRKHDHMHNRVGEVNGPVVCPGCGKPSAYDKCWTCGHAFKEPWLRPFAERKQRLHVGSGAKQIIPPTTQEILSRKAR